MIENVIPEVVYQRICNNRPFGNNLKPYPKNILNEVLEYFEKKEEFEKCQFIKDFIKDRFNHNKKYTTY